MKNSFSGIQHFHNVMMTSTCCPACSDPTRYISREVRISLDESKYIISTYITYSWMRWTCKGARVCKLTQTFHCDDINRCLKQRYPDVTSACNRFRWRFHLDLFGIVLYLIFNLCSAWELVLATARRINTYFVRRYRWNPKEQGHPSTIFCIFVRICSERRHQR